MANTQTEAIPIIDMPMDDKELAERVAWVGAMLSHPLRVRVLAALQTRQASPKELGEFLEEPLGNVSYHIRCLAELGAVRLSKTARRRGAVEHYYRLTLKARGITVRLDS